MTLFAHPFQQLVVVDGSRHGRVVSEGTLILPATNSGMRQIAEHIGVTGPGVYWYAYENGKPAPRSKEVSEEMRRSILASVEQYDDPALPPLRLARLRIATTRRVWGHEVPDVIRHLYGDGYVVRVSEGMIQLATGCDQAEFGRFRFWGSAPSEGVRVADEQGTWLGILMPIGSGGDGGAP